MWLVSQALMALYMYEIVSWDSWAKANTATTKDLLTPLLKGSPSTSFSCKTVRVNFKSLLDHNGVRGWLTHVLDYPGPKKPVKTVKLFEGRSKTFLNLELYLRELLFWRSIKTAWFNLQTQVNCELNELQYTKLMAKSAFSSQKVSLMIALEAST